jgi:hypothetical protein
MLRCSGSGADVGLGSRAGVLAATLAVIFLCAFAWGFGGVRSARTGGVPRAKGATSVSIVATRVPGGGG